MKEGPSFGVALLFMVVQWLLCFFTAIPFIEWWIFFMLYEGICRAKENKKTTNQPETIEIAGERSIIPFSTNTTASMIAVTKAVFIN